MSNDTDTVVESLSSQTREVFKTLLQQPLVPMSELRAEVEAYLDQIDEKSREYEFMDAGRAREIAKRYFELFEAVGENLPERDRRLVQAGVRYFIESHDAEDDFTSPIGFDDDARVAEAVLDAIGHET